MWSVIPLMDKYDGLTHSNKIRHPKNFPLDPISLKCVQFQILVASLVKDMGIWFFRDPAPPIPMDRQPEFPASTCATSTAERRPPFPPAFSSLVAPRGEGMEGAALSPSRRMERRERISKNSLACGACQNERVKSLNTHWWRYSMCLGMPMITQFQWPVRSLGISPLLPH